MKRHEIINKFIEARGYTRYLEIGIDYPANCFDKVKCDHKVGVEPTPKWGINKNKNIAICDSNHFFASSDDSFDLIFVDGLHVADQVYRDIMNAVKFLRKDGVIIVHDVDCESEWMGRPQSQYKVGEAWKGDVWKGWYRATCELVESQAVGIYTLMTDEGCGIIDFGNPKFSINEESYDPSITWKDYNKRKQAFLNPITYSEFESVLSLMPKLTNEEATVSNSELSESGSYKKRRGRAKLSEDTIEST